MTEREGTSAVSEEVLRAALDAADKAVDDLCQGRLRWEMRVPAEPDHDPDLIISKALAMARAALAAIPLASLDVAEAYDAGHHDGMEDHDDVGYCQHDGSKYVKGRRL